MSWGIRITILYLAFVALIGTMVFMTMREKVDLVSDDYYQKELNFQKQIDRSAESNKLSEQPAISVDGENVNVKFPSSITPKSITGKIHFLRPSDATRDLDSEVAVADDGIDHISKGKFVKGLYQVQMNWSSEGKDYYNEFSLYIP